MIRPVLFNTEMVKAILDGRKTVTRRVIKPRYKKDESGFIVLTNMGTGEHTVEKVNEEEGTFDRPRYVYPPYQPGDILYVRETIWQKIGRYLDVDGETKSVFVSEFKYVATDGKPETGWNYSWAKRPSIHMPKEAARIFLKVMDVRVERLQDMTLDDFLNEGITIPYEAFNDPDNAYMQGKELFTHIWDSTIDKEQHDLYGWDANPWVWVIEFERCEKPEDFEV